MFEPDTTGLNPLFIIYYYRTMNISFDEVFDLPEIQESWANVIENFKDWKQVRFRILWKSLTWFSRWEVNGDKTRSFVSTTKPSDLSNVDWWVVKEVRAFPIFDKEDDKVKVLAVKQIPIQRALKELYESSDWGSFIKYDIKIERKGSTQKDTTYSATPLPPSSLTEDQIKIIWNYEVDLKAYFEWKDPVVFDEKF